MSSDEMKNQTRLAAGVLPSSVLPSGVLPSSVPLSVLPPIVLRSIVLVSALLVSTLLLWACGAPEEASNEATTQAAVPSAVEAEQAAPRFVLLYATCTLNKHFLSPYSEDARLFTPSLDEFAREAVVFERHMTESGQSGTAFASIFTGLQAEEHGVFRHPTQLSDELELIGEVFRDGGFRVEAWLEHGMASGELGYAQGAHGVRSTLFRAEDPDFQALLDELEQNPQSKALALVNFTVTHGPYQIAALDAYCGRRPEACEIAANREEFLRYAEFYRDAHAFLSYDFPATAERTGLQGDHLRRLTEVIELLYLANTAYLDHLFGAVLAELERRGLADQSIVAFTADHGETLYREGTHFKWTHGHQLAPEVLEVPWIVRAPGVAPRRWQGVTRSIDVLPTLASLSGLSAQRASGFDLSPALFGVADEPTLRAFSHTTLLAEPVLESSRKWSLFHRMIPEIDPELMWVQIRDGDRVAQLRRTLDGTPEPAIYDAAADPLHLENRFDARNSEHRRLLQDLRVEKEKLVDAWNSRVGGAEVDRERQKELLRNLGYIDD